MGSSGGTSFAALARWTLTTAMPFAGSRGPAFTAGQNFGISVMDEAALTRRGAIHRVMAEDVATGRLPPQPQAVRTNLDRQGVLAQALAQGPLGQQIPGLRAAKFWLPVSEWVSMNQNYFFSLLLHLVRVSSGFSGYDRRILGLTLSFHLTIMVHFPESSTYRGAKRHPGGPALALRTQPMATTLVSVETREVVRCDHCRLVQYRTSNSLCRKCHKPLDVEEPAQLAPHLSPAPPCRPPPRPGCRWPARCAISAMRAT